MLVYQFRVSIMGLARMYRLIEASEGCTFEDLHQVIFEAFDRFDEHMYAFYLTKKDTKNIRCIWQSPEITHPEMLKEDLFFGDKKRMSSLETNIGNIDLAEKDVFHYLFDFGDEWWHRIRVQEVRESKDEHKFIEIIKSVGSSPEQY